MIKKKWKSFKINELFIIKRGQFTSVDKDKSEDNKEFKYKYISALKKRNGVSDYCGINKDKDKFLIKNFIGINNTGDGGCGLAFYHENLSIVSSVVTVLILKTHILNKYIALFICTCLNKFKQKYSFSIGLNNKKLLNEQIMLPVDAKDQPDWQFMEDYIKERARKISFQPIKKFNYPQTKFIQKQNWKSFKICDIFNITHGKRITKKDSKKGNIKLKTAGKINQGFKRRIDSNNKLKLNNKKCITIDMFSNCFFENNTFYYDDNIFILKIKKNIDIYYAYFFLSTILKESLKKNYSYTRQVREKRLKNEIIMLPTDENNQPDWQFMEDYIKERARNINF